MTCKTTNHGVVPEKKKSIRTKQGLGMKRKAGTRTDRNTILNRNCLRHESITKSSDNESTHLVETEFKILQSLIPGISNQLEDHLVQNPQLNMQYQDTIGNNKNSSSELLNRLIHGHQYSQNDTTLESSRDETLLQNQPKSLISVCTGTSNDTPSNATKTH